jgi:ribosomal protein L16 Arg81 hydroxylase
VTVSAAGLALVDAPAGDELRSLLGPVSPEQFVGEYWARKPLFVKGFPDKYAGFFDGAAFSRALSAPGPVPEDFLRASFDRKTETGRSALGLTPGAPRSSVFRATVEQAVPLFDAGATLCVSKIETRAPQLLAFLAAIKRQLGYPGNVSFNSYLSPPGSGFNWHFDSRIASTLQIEGTKRWRFSNHPAIAWPRANGTLDADGTAHYSDPRVTALDGERLAGFDERDTTEVLLEPGDLLILPAGVWHEACGGAGGSLALNLSFSAVSYTALVRDLLDTLLTPEAGWRGPAPVLPASVPGEVDPAGVAAISAQLARAAAVLDTLRGDSAAVVRLWQSQVNSANPPAPAATARAADASIVPTTRLRRCPGANPTATLADGGTLLCLTLGGNRTMDITGATIPFVQRLLTAGPFVASDCLSWNQNGAPFDWDDVASLLTSLCRGGLIETA